MIYIAVLICLVILLYHYDIKGRVVNKDYWYWLVLMALVVISGLRYRIGGDTVNYLYSYYHEIPVIWDVSYSGWDNQGSEPLFYLFNSIVKSTGAPFFVFQLLHAIIVNGLIFAYIKKHSDYCFTCVFFYFIWMYALYNFEEMRASMSLSVCLFANDYIVDKKWLKGLLLYIIGTLFHYSTIVMLITPLFLVFQMNAIGILFLMLSFGFGFVIQSKFGDYLMLFELNDQMAEKAGHYANSEFYFEQHKSLRGIIITVIPYVIYSYLAVWLLKKGILSKQGKTSLLRLQPMLVLGLMFVFFSVPMPICYRFVRFYIIYFILFFSYLFCGWIKRSPQLSASLGLVRSLIVFIPVFNIISHIYRDPIRESSEAHPYYPYEKYIPYSSVIEKSVDSRRERLYKQLSSIDIDLRPKNDEY